MPKSYLDRKEAWAKKMIEKGGLHQTERSNERLPPGQHTVEKLPILDLGIQPKIDKKDSHVLFFLYFFKKLERERFGNPHGERLEAGTIAAA